MGAIPTQRESMARAPDAPANHRAGQELMARTSLAGTPLAPGAARRFLHGALADWAQLALPGTEIIDDRLTEDALVVVSELVTNAVVHAGTDVELLCHLEGRADGAPGPLVVEVSDQHPSRGVCDDSIQRPYGTPEYGRGLRLVAALSEAWGITYRPGIKTVWARLLVDAGGRCDGGAGSTRASGGEATVGGEGMPGGDGIPDDNGIPGARRFSDAEGRAAYAAEQAEQALERGLRAGETLAHEMLPPEPRRNAQQDLDWLNRGALSFLAEASDLLAGQLDEDLVAALAGQLLVPRLADWCAVWLEDEATDRMGGLGLALGPRLARVWHGSENRIEDLRRALEKDPPRLPDAVRSRAVPVPWPGEALGAPGASGAALGYRLIAGGRPLGTLVIGRAGRIGFPDEITGLVEDLSRRIALAIGAARQYARQATISRVLQRGLLPGAVAEIPGVRSALVYEPLDKGGPSGDFYDLFPAGDGRWCFTVGDVQGKGPEAAVVIGLARPWLRLLAREGYDVADVLDRLNQLLLDDATEAADAAARALVAAGAPGLGADLGPQTRFLSLLYGELVPFDGGVRCTIASAGHPLPLLLGPDGDVREVARPQTLLGVVEDAGYTSETFELYPGDTMLCVTDGVTERRSGPRQFDDDDGLAKALAGCAGLSAELIAERIRRLVHEFGSRPPEDDMALLVLQAE
ncbi:MULTISPECIES: SpoIIE family protein phosphatase [Streptomyces]|uniref:Protein phosphatase n=1 Tax=Streptomyces dengpaensis TaxID=2049881 RepID=A0ABN5I6R3_9ACTN|nr:MULTISPECIES: SpoIIE family protein phosphatase [Streptomyces]AVH58804.1 protein phosphatase [Streptomyces dengpaensis]PIB11140.1 protein phosphatase [Streptomyces sp. HG99]